MATPTSGAIATENKATAGAVVAESGTAAQSLYPAKNLIDPERTRRFRVDWTSAGSDTTTVVLDLGSDQTPTIVALVDLNAKTGTFRLQGSADSALTSPDNYDSTLYDAGDSGVHIFYPTVSTARRYWAINFAEALTGTYSLSSYLELGCVWIGTYTDIEVQAGASVNLSDPSKLAQSYGGSVYLDRQTPFRTALFSVEQLTLANAYALQSELATAGGREVVVDLHSSSSDATLRDSGAIYGRAGASPASATLSSGSGSIVDLQIAESRK